MSDQNGAEEYEAPVEIPLKYLDLAMTAIEALVNERSNLTIVFVPLYFTILGLSTLFSPLEKALLYLVSILIVIFWYLFVARIDAYMEFYFGVVKKIENYLSEKFKESKLENISPEILFEREFRKQYGKTKRYSRYTKMFAIVFLTISSILIISTLLSL